MYIYIYTYVTYVYIYNMYHEFNMQYIFHRMGIRWYKKSNLNMNNLCKIQNRCLMHSM